SLGLADIAAAKIRPRQYRGAQSLPPHRRIERHIDETRSCDLDLGDLRALAKLGCNPLGEIAWLYARVLGKRHGGVGGKVAMGGIPRRFYHDSLEVRRTRKRPCGSESFDGRADVRGEEGEHVHATRLTQFRSRVKKPGMLGKRIA